MYLEKKKVGLSLEEFGGGGGAGELRVEVWVKSYSYTLDCSQPRRRIPLPAIGWFTLIHSTLLPILSMIAISHNRKLQL